MPPARALLVAASLAGVGWLVRALFVGPPSLPWALGALAAYLAFVAVGVLASGLSMFADVVTRGPADARGVALTFDGGPEPSTTALLLDALDAAGAKATFFLCGPSVEQHPELARKIVSRGHLLGLCAVSGDRARVLYRARRMRNELERARAAVERATGVRVTLFRTARGHLTPAMAGVVRDLELVVVGWSAGGLEPRPFATAGTLEREVVRRLVDGAIVRLPHARTPTGTVPASIDALPAILAAMARLQLRSARLDEWLAES